ncbi:MAG: hypothetical protein QOH97_4625 [Actinoplanes sp.]|jgi:hypothetical protein|nr:hypothetical protein [Actinoplanes sp.]
MTIIPPPPGVYRSRAHTTRRRVLAAAAGLALVLLGYLIGRLQGFDAPTGRAVAAPSPTASASTEPAPSAEPSAPSVAPTSLPADALDAYAPVQAEAAAAQQGTQSEDTSDEGGGKDVGYVNNGDWLRFDDVNFGDTPATKLLARVSSQSDTGGRMEIRLDTPANPPVATLAMSNTGGWQKWQTRSADLTPVTGLHTVFVTFGNDTHDEFMNVNYFSFAH